MDVGSEAIGTDRRRHQREEVTLAASAMSITRSRSVMIADVSAEGARLGGRDLPGPGKELLMIIGSQDRMGKVAWRTVDECGVSLDEPFDAADIDRMKREAHWAAVTGWGA
jgi:hypothetical protein